MSTQKRRGRPPTTAPKPIMRGTSMSLPVDLLRRAKVYAAQHDSNLSLTVAAALTKFLEGNP